MFIDVHEIQCKLSHLTSPFFSVYFIWLKSTWNLGKEKSCIQIIGMIEARKQKPDKNYDFPKLVSMKKLSFCISYLCWCLRNTMQLGSKDGQQVHCGRGGLAWHILFRKAMLQFGKIVSGGHFRTLHHMEKQFLMENSCTCINSRSFRPCHLKLLLFPSPALAAA